MLDVKLMQTAEQSVELLSREAPDFLETLKQKYPDGFSETEFSPNFWHAQCNSKYPKAATLFSLAEKRGANIFGFFAGLELFKAKNLLAEEFRNYDLLKNAYVCFCPPEDSNLEQALKYTTRLGLYYGLAVGYIHKMKVYLAFNLLDKARDAYQQALNANWLGNEYQPIRDYDESVANLTVQAQELLYSHNTVPRSVY